MGLIRQMGRIRQIRRMGRMSQISLMSHDSFLIAAGLGGACPTLPALLSFHLFTFSPSHLLTFSPFHFLTFSLSHLFTFSPFHLLTFSPSHAVSSVSSSAVPTAFLGSSFTLHPVRRARTRVLSFSIFVSGWNSTCTDFTLPLAVKSCGVAAGLVDMPILNVPRRLSFTRCDIWHYKIFCVNGNTGFRNESRIFLFYTFAK